MVKILVISLFLSVAVFLRSVGGYVEGYLFPVVTPGQIERIDFVDGISVRIWGNSARLRQCQFNRLEWRLGDRHAYSVVDLAFEESAKVRASGDFSFGPWRLHLTQKQLRERSYAWVYHRCHWLWLTRSRFYG
ncbi:hypothetical protein [Cognatishimia sp. MH4019]|uniref:hypothetical protein n=1 Tax=Cognatishimia sp. MH4019 TaxID=2854030 RepID=UPI001CD7AAF6|nr:hypothetical protein [Cognatishimia sp. MH4019]